MNSLKIVSLFAKVFGFIAGLDTIPFVPSSIGIWIFLAASIAKDVFNRISDLLDDGKENQSILKK